MRATAEDGDPWESADPALAVALQQLQWYRRAADRARFGNQLSDVLLLVTSAATTVSAALSAAAWITALLAAGTLVLTGLRKSFDWHANWVSYIATWSALRTEIHQYRLLPEAQRDEKAQRSLLAKVDEIGSAEMNSWSARRRELQDQR